MKPERSDLNLMMKINFFCASRTHESYFTESFKNESAEGCNLKKKNDQMLPFNPILNLKKKQWKGELYNLHKKIGF